MRVVDTSAWIEWLAASAMDKTIIPLLPSNTDWLVPTMVQYELAKWAARTHGDDHGNRVLAFTGMRRVALLTTPIAVAAAEIGREHGLAAADAIIYATALRHGADLLTCDVHFKDLPQVVYVPKSEG